jgi:hypothetical protein
MEEKNVGKQKSLKNPKQKIPIPILKKNYSVIIARNKRKEGIFIYL